MALTPPGIDQCSHVQNAKLRDEVKLLCENMLAVAIFAFLCLLLFTNWLLLLYYPFMDELRYKQMREKLDADFRAVEAEYHANIAALDRVIAMERLLSPQSPQAEPQQSARTGGAAADPMVDDIDLSGLDIADHTTTATQKGSVLTAVEEVIEDLPETFTWMNVYDYVIRRDPTATIKPTSVRQAMTRCIDLNLIEIEKPGAGRAPTIYRRAGSNRGFF